MMKLVRLIVCALVGAGALSAANAQDWPKRPLTLVVPFAPGGGVDVSARIQAQKMSELPVSRSWWTTWAAPPA